MTEGITYVVPSTTAPTLPNGVVAAESLRGEGDAPGAVAYVDYNGLTEQLATMCTGLCNLEPGATPHFGELFGERAVRSGRRLSQ